METVMSNAAAIGMEVNPAKTQLLCITSAINYQVWSYIYCQGEKLASGDSLKLLGYTMGRRPTAEQHVKSLRRKYGARAWILRNLNQAGIAPAKICPDVLFASGQCLNTQRLFFILECLKKRLTRLSVYRVRPSDQSLAKCCPTPSVWWRPGLKTLKERQEELMLSFARRVAESERFSQKWLPTY